MMQFVLNGEATEAEENELLIEVLKRTGSPIPHLCYHAQLGPIQTCDTCMVEVNGAMARACATRVAEGMRVSTASPHATAAQAEAFDRILSNHLLYCTVCDNNNGDCEVHNATKMLSVEHQNIPFQPKPYEVDESKPSIATTPASASCAVAASRLARTWRSTRRSRSTGKIRIQGSFGMEGRLSASPAVSPAGIA